MRIIKELIERFKMGKSLNNYELIYIIKKCPLLRLRAGKKLLKQKPDDLELFYVIKFVRSLRQKAWQKILEKRGINDTLFDIMNEVRSLRHEAAQKLLKEIGHNFLDNTYLRHIIIHEKSLRHEAAQKLLKSPNVNCEDLYLIIKKIPSLRRKAGKKILKFKPIKGKPSNNQLRFVIIRVLSLREKAGLILFKQYRTEADLRCIIKYVKPLRLEAKKLLKKKFKRGILDSFYHFLSDISDINYKNTSNNYFDGLFEFKKDDDYFDPNKPLKQTFKEIEETYKVLKFKRIPIIY